MESCQRHTHMPPTSVFVTPNTHHSTGQLHAFGFSESIKEITAFLCLQLQKKKGPLDKDTYFFNSKELIALIKWNFSEESGRNNTRYFKMV